MIKTERLFIQVMEEENPSNFNKIYKHMRLTEKLVQKEPECKREGYKETKFYHVFNVGNRTVTLCILTNDNYFDTNVKIGYSVRMPEDREIEGLSRKIAYGRAKKRAIDGGYISDFYKTNRGVLRGVAYYWEGQFKKDLGRFIKSKKI